MGIGGMKTIYLVRHGESHSNTGAMRATTSSPLTDAGRAQAQQLAERCAKLPIDIIIVGTSTRAEETALIVANKISKDFISSELFAERRKPSQQNGKPKNDPATRVIDETIRDNFHMPGYRYSDEENFDDLKSRMSFALDYLLNLEDEHVLVITHGIILRILIARVLMGEELSGKECKKFHRDLRMNNTGICILKHTDYLDEEGRSSPWQLWSWNDTAHLG
jgi:broad specificity phosphatase PhoE